MNETKRARLRVRGQNIYLVLTLLNSALFPVVAVSHLMQGWYASGACFAIASLFGIFAAWHACKSDIHVSIVEIRARERTIRNIDRFDNWKDAMSAFYSEDRKTDVPSDGGISAAFLNWLFAGLSKETK